MIKRKKHAKRKVHARKHVAKKRRKTVKLKKAFANKKPSDPNMKANLKAYRTLEKKINETWTKLQKAVKEKRANAVLTGRENLKLLLGECTYMANECKRWARLSKGARRNRR